MTEETVEPSLIDELQAIPVVIEPEDTMAEAGRKLLLVDFIKALKHEAGSRLGEDIEAVHDMRVATRRMRSAFRLLENFYKPGTIRPLVENLKGLARKLGAVRDLDVLLEDLQKAVASDQQEILQPVLDHLDKKRRKARKKLIALLDSKDFQDFVANYTHFLTTSGLGAKAIDDQTVVPYQVRHVLPGLLYDHLAAVRAYDTVIETADAATLHALRIEFKRLRYAVSFFTDVLGNSGDDFISEIKTIQDHLGRMNDIQVAQEQLTTLLEDEELDASLLDTYLSQLKAEHEQLTGAFPAVWQRFNTRTVQSKLSNALLALR